MLRKIIRMFLYCARQKYIIKMYYTINYYTIKQLFIALPQ
jgi:hypothetical protein